MTPDELRILAARADAGCRVSRERLIRALRDTDERVRDLAYRLIVRGRE